jgi:hypothetical protein
VKQMRIIVRPRQGGKTTELLRMAAEHGYTVVCATTREAQRLYRITMADTRPLDMSPVVITWDDFIHKRFGAAPIKTNGFVIDDLGWCLQTMVDVPVAAISVNGSAESVDTTLPPKDPRCDVEGCPEHPRQWPPEWFGSINDTPDILRHIGVPGPIPPDTASLDRLRERVMPEDPPSWTPPHVPWSW